MTNLFKKVAVLLLASVSLASCLGGGKEEPKEEAGPIQALVGETLIPNGKAAETTKLLFIDYGDGVGEYLNKFEVKFKVSEEAYGKYTLEVTELDKEESGKLDQICVKGANCKFIENGKYSEELTFDKENTEITYEFKYLIEGKRPEEAKEYKYEIKLLDADKKVAYSFTVQFKYDPKKEAVLTK